MGHFSPILFALIFSLAISPIHAEIRKVLLFEAIPDSEIAADMEKVDAAIHSVDHNELWGITPLDSVEKTLTAAQRALFRRQWEMETIQEGANGDKPATVPEQLDLVLFTGALDVLVGMDAGKVHFEIDQFEEWAKRREGEDGEEEAHDIMEPIKSNETLVENSTVSPQNEKREIGKEGIVPGGIAKMALHKMVEIKVGNARLKIEEEVEIEEEIGGGGGGGRKKRSNDDGQGEGGGKKTTKEKMMALKRHLMDGMLETVGKSAKRDEKLAYIWYSELQYWLGKQLEAANDGMEGKDDDDAVIDDELDFLRVEWAKSSWKLAKLRKWIGAEYRRKK